MYKLHMILVIFLIRAMTIYLFSVSVSPNWPLRPLQMQHLFFFNFKFHLLNDKTILSKLQQEYKIKTV